MTAYKNRNDDNIGRETLQNIAVKLSSQQKPILGWLLSVALLPLISLLAVIDAINSYLPRNFCNGGILLKTEQAIAVSKPPMFVECAFPSPVSKYQGVGWQLFT